MRSAGKAKPRKPNTLTRSAALVVSIVAASVTLEVDLAVQVATEAAAMATAARDFLRSNIKPLRRAL